MTNQANVGQTPGQKPQQSPQAQPQQTPGQTPQAQPQQTPGQKPQQTPPLTPQTPQPQPQGSSGLAIAGMVLGILAAASSFVPIVNNISFFIALIGLALSIAGLVRARQGKSGGKGIAVAGMVLCIAALVVTLAVQAACSAALDSLSSSASASRQSGSAAASAAASASAASAKHVVTIDDAQVGADYEGKPALIVTYTWQNNSDKETSFAVSIGAKGFQNGVELEPALMVDGVDSGASLAQVKPGSTTTVKEAYLLTDQSPVDVEVRENFSLSDELLAAQKYDVS